MKSNMELFILSSKEKPMGKIVLCDRCEAIIKNAVVKQVRFVASPSCITFYDVCDKCYDRLKEYMKTKEMDSND